MILVLEENKLLLARQCLKGGHCPVSRYGVGTTSALWKTSKVCGSGEYLWVYLTKDSNPKS